MNERLKERIAEEWAMLDPVDPLRRLLSDVIDVLAQPAQGPVGKFAKFTDGVWREVTNGSAGVSLYTTPPKREWVGLTDDQFLEAARLAEDGNYLVAFQRIQQWLKEKNT